MIISHFKCSFKNILRKSDLILKTSRLPYLLLKNGPIALWKKNESKLIASVDSIRISQLRLS